MHEEWGYQSEDLLRLAGVVMHEEWENQSERMKVVAVGR